MLYGVGTSYPFSVLKDYKQTNLMMEQKKFDDWGFYFLGFKTFHDGTETERRRDGRVCERMKLIAEIKRRLARRKLLHSAVVDGAVLLVSFRPHQTPF